MVIPWLCLTLCLTLFGQTDSVNTARENKIQKIKLAYIVNFIRFTTWPQSHLPTEDTPLVISIIDQTDNSKDMADALNNYTIDKHPVKVQLFDKLQLKDNHITEEQISKLRQSHVIYYRNSNPTDIRVIAEIQQKMRFLYIGDMKHFAKDGGMIGFEESTGKITFMVNINTIRQSDIQVSSKVLRLGIAVR